jgi:hypothetical protein
MTANLFNNTVSITCAWMQEKEGNIRTKHATQRAATQFVLSNVRKMNVAGDICSTQGTCKKCLKNVGRETSKVIDHFEYLNVGG